MKKILKKKIRKLRASKYYTRSWKDQLEKMRNWKVFSWKFQLGMFDWKGLSWKDRAEVGK